MAKHSETSAVPQVGVPGRDRDQQRHTMAALVYFLYGLFYLFGAQYLTSMGMSERGMANPKIFFVIGTGLVIVLPLLIYSRFALALSLWWKPQAQRKTLFINFTLILGLLVVARVLALLRGGLFLTTPWHTAALLVAALNAACLLWAGLSRPVWVRREAQGP